MTKSNRKKIVEGKVVKIIDTHKIAINIGSEAGVEEGDTFRVGKGLVEIIDPENSENLGHFINTIEKLEATDVYPKFSILKKIVRKRQGGSLSDTFSGISALTMSDSLYGKTKVYEKDIKVDKSEIEPTKEDDSNVISISDVAVFYE